MPAASWIGLSATISCIVEQFGLAIRPLWPLERVRVDLGDDERDLGVAPPLARSCRRRPRRRRRSAAPTRRRSRRRPRRSPGRSPGSSRRSSGWTIMPSSSRPAERSEANGTISRAGKSRSRSFAQHHGADGAGRADDGDSVTPALPPRPEGMLGLDLVGAELEGLVQRAHGAVDGVGRDDAGDLDRRRGDHLDVDALARRAWRTPCAATPGCVFIPAPTTDTLPISGSVGDRADAELAGDPVERRARVAQVRSAGR